MRGSGSGSAWLVIGRWCHSRKRGCVCTSAAVLLGAGRTRRIARQAQGEHSAAARPVFGTYIAAVFSSGRFSSDRQTQPRAARFARRVGFEPALVESLGQARTVVGDGQFDPRTAIVLNLARGDLNAGSARVADRLQRVLQQIVQQLAQAPGIGAQRRICGCEVGASAGCADRFPYKSQHFADQRMQQQRPRDDFAEGARSLRTALTSALSAST